MAVLFTQYWDVIPGKFDQYSEFVSKEYNPTLQRIGLKLLGGYYVAVGQGPRVIVAATIDDGDYLRKILATKEYRDVTLKLLMVVHKYSSRLWVSSGSLVQHPYSINMGAWKFNQLYNVVPGMEDEHYRFVKDECMPGMQELRVPVTGAWRLLIGEGPTILAECTARNIETIAKAIDTDLFRRMVRRLKKHYATDYSSRILSPTGRIEVPSMLGAMMKGF